MQSNIDDFEKWNGGMEAGAEEWSESPRPPDAKVPLDELRRFCEKWKCSESPDGFVVRGAPVDGAFQIAGALKDAGYTHVGNSLTEDWEGRKPGQSVRHTLTNWYQKGGTGLAIEHDQHPANISGSAEIRGRGFQRFGKTSRVKENPNHDDHGRFAEGSGRGSDEESSKADSRTSEQSPSPKTKAMIAKQSATYVGKDIQRYAEEHNEPQFAKGIGGLSYADNEPVDVVAGAGGVVEHGCELKTMVSNKASKLTMDRYAQVRKVAWEADKKATFHTVVIDDREVYNANGEGEHDESKRTYYYRRGVAGSARIESMHQCKSLAEVKKLMKMPESELPKGAQRTDGKLHEGKWREISDKEGRGFKNSKTGEIVRPKK